MKGHKVPTGARYLFAVGATLVIAGLAWAGAASLLAARPVVAAAPASPLVILPARPGTAPVSLQLAGTVVDTGGATSAIATVRVGTSITTTAISLPNYTLAIAAPSATSMVTIEVAAPGIRYASILGSYGRLVKRAGADRVLTVSELDRVRLSPMSTALWFFVQRDLGGQLPSSDTQHETSMRYLLGDDIVDAASTLHRFATGTLAHPAGFSDGVAVLDNQATYRHLLASSRLSAADQDLYLRSVQSIPLASTDIGKAVMLTAFERRGAPTLINSGTQILQAAPDGYQLSLTTAMPTDSWTPALVDGDLAFTPQVYGGYELTPIDPVTGLRVHEWHTLLKVTLRRFFVGDQVTLWLQINDGLVMRPDDPNFPNTPERFVGLVSGVPLQAMGRQRGVPLVPGNYALPTFCIPPTSNHMEACDHAVHELPASGSGLVTIVDAKVDNALAPADAAHVEGFRVSPDEAAFAVSYDRVDVKYWRVDHVDGAADELVYVARGTLNAHEQLAGRTLMIRVDPTLTAAAAGEGTWTYGTYEQGGSRYAFNANDVPLSTRSVRSADGRSVLQRRTDLPEFDATLNYDSLGSWQVRNGAIYDTNYGAPINPTSCAPGIRCFYFSSCADALAAGAAACAPSRVRYFKPLARVGSRVYGIEGIYVHLNDNPNYYAPPFAFSASVRASYYDRQ